MREVWIDSAVKAFGAQMGFENFALNENGVAAARFENGASVALELIGDAMYMQVRIPLPPEAQTIKGLLTASHPDARWFPHRLRTVYLAKRGEGALVVKINERDVTEQKLNELFSSLWLLASNMRA